MMKKNDVYKALQAVASAIEALDQREIDALIAGKGKLIFISCEKNEVSTEKPALDLSPLVERLTHCQSRDDARRILAGLSNKDAAISLAKLLKVHISKSDRREEIEQKIIEFAIGRKLRTEAISTLNLTGGSELPPNEG